METPFFDRKRLIKIGSFFLGGVGVVVLLGWLGNKYQGIKIDWSTLVPLGAGLAAAIPLVQGIVGYIEGKAKLADDRLDKLEVQTASLEEGLKRSSQDRAELRKIILKLEARIESIRDNQVGTNLGQLSSQIQQILQRLPSD